MFNQFFAKYEVRLSLEGGAPRAAAIGASVVHEMEEYCRQQVKC